MNLRFRAVLLAVAVGMLLLAGVNTRPASGTGTTPPPTSLPDGLEAGGKAALETMLPVVKNKSPRLREELGFSPSDDLSDLHLGKPFELQILNPNEIVKKDAENNVQKLLVRSGQWYFPLISQNRTVSLLSVVERSKASGLSGSVWVADSLGMPKVANEWNAVTTKWPLQKGYTPMLIMFPPNGQYFFTIPQVSFPNLTPLNLPLTTTDSAHKKMLWKAGPTISQLLGNHPQ